MGVVFMFFLELDSAWGLSSSIVLKSENRSIQYILKKEYLNKQLHYALIKTEKVLGKAQSKKIKIDQNNYDYLYSSLNRSLWKEKFQSRSIASASCKSSMQFYSDHLSTKLCSSRAKYQYAPLMTAMERLLTSKPLSK